MFTTQPTKRSNSITLPDPPTVCLERPDTCNSTIASMTLDLYRNHGNGTFNRTLNNVNLADAIGEAYWLCDYHPSGSPLISKFRLTVDPQFTDYMLCNHGSCEGSSYGQQYGVGKQNNDGTAKCDVYPIPSGQNYECQLNYCPSSGSWYAFTAMGRCPPKKPIGYNNCTWLDKYQTIKTITIDCLQQHSHNQYNCSTNDLAFWASELTRAFKYSIYFSFCVLCFIVYENVFFCRVCPDVQNLTQINDEFMFSNNANNININFDDGMPLAKNFRKRRIWKIENLI